MYNRTIDVEPIASHALSILSNPSSIVDLKLNTRLLTDTKPQVMKLLQDIRLNYKLIQAFELLFKYADKYIATKSADNSFIKTQDIDYWKNRVKKQSQIIEQMLNSEHIRKQINNLVSQFNSSEDEQLRRSMGQLPNKAYH